MELLIFTIIFLVCLSVGAYFVDRKIRRHYEVMLRNQRDIFVQSLKEYEARVRELREEDQNAK